jgi:hypothetical protein
LLLNLMSRTIQHFMWGYQDMYRIHVQGSAESALKRLDEELSPEVFLVGILQEEKENRYPACVEPESEHWTESEAFDGVAEIAASIGDSYPEAQMSQSHPLAQQRQDDALYRRSIRDAILEVVENHPAKPEGMSFFASIPEMVEGYLVSAVLSVRTDVLNSRHRLTSGEVSLHPCRNMPVSRSLIDATIYELLTEAADGLLAPDPGLRTRSREAEETIRSAGRRLARDTAFRVNKRGIQGVHWFYDACDKISSLKYEQAEGRGRLLLAPRDQEGVRTQISLKDSVALWNHRRMRKLLELTSQGGLLHTDSEGVFGLVEWDVPADPEETVFEVVFLGHYHWELRHAGELLMGVRFSQPYLPKLVGYESKLRQDLPRIFAGISTDATELLVSLVRQAERERHGTLVVISAEAAAESTRLKNQATPIEPCVLTTELLEHLTGIDGAVLVGTDGFCHAVGVILDGQATAKGDPGRGARFNSAMRYVESTKARGTSTIAIVVSEDGGVDVIPSPRPMIKRSLISNAVAEIEQITKVANIQRRRYNDLYDWLLKHRFYLLLDDCERVNLAVQEIERRLQEEFPSAIWVIRHKFEPDPEMQPSFYYEPEDQET